MLHLLIIKCNESKTTQMVRSDYLNDDGSCQEHSFSSAANKSNTKWLLTAISLQMNMMLLSSLPLESYETFNTSHAASWRDPVCRSL